MKMSENLTVKHNCEISSQKVPMGYLIMSHWHFKVIKKIVLESEVKELGNDMWKQLKRVQIPVFSGDKRRYEPW